MHPYRARLRATIAGTLVAATTAGLIATLPPLLAQAAPALPPGFLLRDIETGLAPGDQLTDFAYLPDESLLSIGKRGRVVWAPRTGTPRQLANLGVSTVGDLGLIGLAVAPDYATSHAVYTTRAVPGSGTGAGVYGWLRLSRWTVSTGADGTPTGLAGEQMLVQTSSDMDAHGITGVVAAEDGTVWLSIGDAADFRQVDRLALRSLDPDDWHGKLLHLRPDGTGVPTNPYYDPAAPRSVRSLTYASGLRSPFRFSLEPVTGRPLLGEVGWNDTEEINLVNPGNNYGWPCWEGTRPTWGYRDMPECAGTTTASPLWSYPHNGGGSVTGGVVYTGSSYPQEYRGRYFFGDYNFRKLFTLRTNERGELATPEPGAFGSEVGYPVKFASVPTGGDIVFADIGSSRLRRLVYAPGNNPPQPVVATTVQAATRTVTFDAGESTDPNGDALTYRWDFGDGTPPADGPAVISHAYPAGTVSATATLTVTDPLGAAASTSTTVHPGNQPPALSVRPPAAGTTYAVGDTVSASATATDAEDGPLGVSWSVTLVHCAGIGMCHNHPGEHQDGPTFGMVFTGHAGDSRVEITASATDSRGATTSETFTVKPRQRRVTVQSTSPATFTIGDEQGTSGLFTVGTNLTIVAPAAAQDGVATFDRWGDGGTDRVRQLRVPDAEMVIPVGYATPIDRRYAADAPLRDRVGAAAAVEQGDSTLRWREHTGGRLYWTPQAGVHYVAGAIKARYLGSGGHLVYGTPTTDETSRDNTGTFNHFQAGASLYWSPGSGTHFVVNGIRAKYAGYGWELSSFGYPTTDETSRDNTGTFNHFQGGSIFWSPSTGIHSVVNGIRAKYASYGWELSSFGYPTTDETSRDNTGTFSHFQGGSIFWSPGGGVHSVVNGIRARYAALGWELSYLGYPTSDEYAVPGGVRSNFQRGYITWEAATGRITDRPY